MPDLRCKCGSKLAEYTDTEVLIMDRKCKSITRLWVIDGKLTKVSIQGADDCNFTKNVKEL